MLSYPQQLATVVRTAGLRNTEGGWSRVRQAIKVIKTLRMFGAEIDCADIFLQNENTEKGPEKKRKISFSPTRLWQR